MGPVTIRIANDLAAISVLQAGAAVFVRNAGFGEEAAWQTGLVLEEILSNIFQYELPADQEGSVESTLSAREGMLEVRLHFRGIPFDVDRIKAWEKTDLSEIVEKGGRGFGLQLIRGFSTDVQYRNLGWEGQEITIQRAVPMDGPAATPQQDMAGRKRVPPVLENILVRRMQSDEAAAVSRLAYFSYGYTYFNEILYLPQKVQQRNADGRMVSYVAVDHKREEIVGHVAEMPDSLSGMPELAAAFVDPDYRRRGCMKAIVSFMMQRLQEGATEGVFATAATSHPYSQIPLTRLGLRESAVLISRLFPTAFQAIVDQAVSRESVMYMVRLFHPRTRKPYYAPSRHLSMIEKICRHVGMSVAFLDIPSDMSVPAAGKIEADADPYAAGHIIVHEWGDNTLARVRSILRSFCLDRLETIYLYLPLFEPSTAAFCPVLEEWGFFFCGIKPGRAGRDWLVLQYLNNQRYDYGRIRTATPFGAELAAYVQACDPDGAAVVRHKDRGSS